MDKKVGILRNNIVRSRSYEFTEEEMRSFRIVKVCNSMSDADYMSERYIDEFIAGCFDPRKGEITIAESAIQTTERGMIRVLSVIVFADVQSMELYILANPKLYLPIDRTMGGRLN